MQPINPGTLVSHLGPTDAGGANTGIQSLSPTTITNDPAAF